MSAMQRGLRGFAREGGGGEYRVILLKIADLERVWQALLPCLLQVTSRVKLSMENEKSGY